MDLSEMTPLSEYLRPHELDQLAISQSLIDRMQTMFESGSISNMLFFGPPGTGKTSAARILCRPRLGYGVFHVDGSKDNGIDYIRERVEGFTTAVALDGGIKIVHIDDGDYLSAQAQAALRGLIERSRACRFIMTVNDIEKIDEAIQSRLFGVQFHAPEAELPEIMSKAQERIARRLLDLGWSFDRDRLNQIVSENFSDLRRMANKIEFELR